MTGTKLHGCVANLRRPRSAERGRGGRRERDGVQAWPDHGFGHLIPVPPPDGCPVAVEVFPGNASDPSTVAPQVARLRTRFGIDRIAMVGDRGMITTARTRPDLEPAGLDWISALRNADIRRLLRLSHGDAPLMPGELVADAVAKIASPDFPGERLMVCPDPRLRKERRRRRVCKQKYGFNLATGRKNRSVSNALRKSAAVEPP